MIEQLLNNWNNNIDIIAYKTISFTKIKLPHGWLGNMSRHPLRVPRALGGTLYPTAEHYFQCERFSDQTIRQAILSKASPMACKWVAKKYRGHTIINGYSPEVLDLMRRTIRLKIENHPQLQNQLLALPEDSVIIEDASRRGGESAGFWGMRRNGNSWIGQNWLGRLWMELRLELAKANTQP